MSAPNAKGDENAGSMRLLKTNHFRMKTEKGHLTYCTNIHGGEAWHEHFNQLRTHLPHVKRLVASDTSMGLGLRLSDQASRTLADERQFNDFQSWLAEQDAYVFTMNGFPFGDFHNQVVKAQVHAPDWATPERFDYTIRLFDLLARLLPAGMDGGISTSPLSYRHWHNGSPRDWAAMRLAATTRIVEVAAHLVRIGDEQGKLLHLDIEPEPDGVLETGPEFIAWYQQELVPLGITVLSERFNCSASEAEGLLKTHIRLCYDVCHFALGYEDHGAVIDELNKQGIQIGKFQISAAIAAKLPADRAVREAIAEAFMGFNEPIYLHQVIARRKDGSLVRFLDLPDAKPSVFDEDVVEWRSHFHVPIFSENLGLLKSTQSDIKHVLDIHREAMLTSHLEAETYTWGVLPGHLQLPIAESIGRELNWIKEQL